MSPHKAAIIANGEIQSYTETKNLLKNYSITVAADGGLIHCDHMNITPQLLIGDLDSCPKNLLEKYSQIPSIVFSKDKNESDLELSIQYLIKEGYQKIDLFGVLGKRTDHLLYSLYLLTRYPTYLTIITPEEILFCLNKAQIIKTSIGQTISLIPFSTVTGVQTKGLKWELEKVTLNKNLISLSNISLGNSFAVEFESGDLICCLIK